LCYLKGHTHDQAAEELECPVGTVRSRLARGRDLLRRRLTSRGHAPTAAILGTETGLPARLLTEVVPPSLVSATVEAALGIGASKSIQAGAASASALALTQGVLTTMKLAQLKLMGLAILATSLSAGSVVAVAYGASQNPKDALDANGVVVNAAGPQEKTAGAVDGSTNRPAVEERLKALEKKLDELLRRSTPVPPVPGGGTTSDPNDPFRRNPGSTKQDDDPRRMVDPQHPSIQELEAELEPALRNEERSRKLFERRAISSEELDLIRARVSIIKAMLEGRDDELSDEIDRAKLEINTKKAEREKATAQTEVALTVVARNTRLNERKAGMVSAEDVAKGEWEMKTASAQVAIIEAEIAEKNLRVQQLERRRARIRQIIKLGGHATAIDR
jgi:hypothetical protein